MAFDCTIRRQGDTITVIPEGDISLETTPLLREILRQVVATLDHGRIDIDAGAVTFLDSSGLAMLVAAQRAAAHRGTTLALRDPGPLIGMVLDISHLRDVLVRDAPVTT